MFSCLLHRNIGDNAVKTGEMTMKALDSYTNLTDKEVAGFERADSNSEISFYCG